MLLPDTYTDDYLGGGIHFKQKVSNPCDTF